MSLNSYTNLSLMPMLHPILPEDVDIKLFRPKPEAETDLDLQAAIAAAYYDTCHEKMLVDDKQ